MDIGLVAAFVGGTLALLSPCAALLLPAFFASTVGTGPRLVGHGALFYLGLVLVLVPIGMGAGLLGSIFLTHRTVIVVVAAAIVILLGIGQIFGFGFDASRLLPSAAHPHTRAASATGVVKTLLLGAASGIAGFCAGPILGAVLTLAATRGEVWSAGLMLAIYGAGMVVPLVVIAALWRRLGPRGQRVLRGRTFTLAGDQFHPTSVLTGVLMILVGIAFGTTNGMVSLPQLVPVETQAWLQSATAALTHPVVDITVIVVAAALVVWRLLRRDTMGT